MRRLAERLIPAILAVLLLIGPAGAAPDEAPFPTVDALETAVIPPRDRVDLARRLLGVTDIPAPPLDPPARQVGETDIFWATNMSENRSFQVAADLRVVSDHLYIWVQQDVHIDPARLATLARLFDVHIYDPMRALWGTEASPGIDGDLRVHALFVYGLGPGVAAYFAADHMQPVEVVSTSNAREMFVMNLDALGTRFTPEAVAGTLAHEFQHMIRENQNPNEDTWLDEGFSTFTEIYTGYPFGAAAMAISYLSRPGVQLNAWADDGPRAPHYGASLLFITYFYERFGRDALRALSMTPGGGLRAVDTALRNLDQPGVDVFFADWVAFNAQDPPPYALLPGLPPVVSISPIESYPYTRTGSLLPYSAGYIVLPALDGVRDLEISFDAPPTLPLIPIDAFNGPWLWYSTRADDSNTTLTRAFDLSSVAAATLEYAVWYEIERLWDYGYVMISADDGVTWDILSTPYTTADNPHNTAYGPGYTGVSNGWRTESLSLDAYAGREILVRFEMITDDAINRPGMAIDAVRIPEIGYSDDFETDGGGWDARGWVHIDNRLPAQAWVQVIGADGVVGRWLWPDDGASWITPAPVDMPQMLVVSPLAPVTTVPMQYTLTVTGR